MWPKSQSSKLKGMCASPFLQYAPTWLNVTSKQWIATVQPCFTLESVMHVCLELRHCLAGHDQRDAELYELMMCGRAMESSMWFRLAPKVWQAVRVTVDC